MRTVVVTEQGATVRAEGKFLVVENGGQVIKRIRTHDVDQLVLMGSVTLSAGAVALVARSEIDTVFLTTKGNFRARLVTRTSKNVPLRQRQWERAWEEPFVRDFVRAVVVGKLTYQRQILLRAQRDQKDPVMADALARMRILMEQAKRGDEVGVLRGYEGAGAALYFGCFGKLVRNPNFSFHGRNRRPPRDPINAALSFGYALLLNTVETEVLRCGLDPYRGFFHEPAHGRPSLVLDLMEELRPTIDLFVLRLVNRRQLGPADFDYKSSAERPVESILASESDGAEGRQSQTDASDALGKSLPISDSQSRPTCDFESPPEPESAARGEDVPFEVRSTDAPAVYLGESGRRIVLTAYYKRLRDRVHYAARGQSLELRQIIREQCYHLARVIEGKEEEYIPFIPR